MAPLKELLDLTYELEALLTLALMREGVPSRLNELIAAKAAAIGAASGLDCNAPAPSHTPEDSISDSYSIEEPETDHEPPVKEEIMESEDEEIIDRATMGAEAPKAQPKPMAEAKILRAEPGSKAGDVLRRRFSLNDKFRFRRELFGGSDADFSEALDIIAGCNNLSDAEDYLYSQLRMDPDDDNVKSFVEVISGYFN